MSLPSAWVDRIFEKLSLLYGREFISRWDGLDLAAVKSDWSHELAGFKNWPEAIKFGLEHLPPDRPPTVLQFRDICRKAPGKAMLALPEPPANPERVQSELAKLAAVPVQRQDAKAWAHRIIERHAAGQPVSIASLRCARAATGCL
jgi:hypothetical protein